MNAQRISNENYEFENGIVRNHTHDRTYPLDSLFKYKEFQTIKLSMVSKGHYFTAYVIDELESYSHTDARIAPIFQSLFEIIQEVDSKICERINVTRFIEMFMRDPERNLELFRMNRRQFMSKMEEHI